MRRIFAALIILIPLLYPVHSVLAKWPKVPILLYHHIDHQVGRWHVTPEKFEKELAYLASTNYHTISLDTYLDAIQKGAALPENPIIITFDDGYDDNYQSAVPLLQKYGLTGTFYIISGMVGTPGFMTWDQIAQLHKAGMEIGAHTIHHSFLTRLPVLKAFGEIWLSKLDIQNHLGIQVHTFAYPNNDHNAKVEVLTQMADFRDAVVVGPHRGDVYDDVFMIHRITVFETQGISAFEALEKT